ncbi:hypothetical protein P3T76_015202 [Phytophthora citrophthora]|uniref:LamG-like jellyroll fold domain-containing protein n=1 Tax=Phytophthora citrophthora TaxID=4793 RepID=A0AAD9FZU2_9STRA|nr:hypothetical protein P3T76_015199 [Phytophthora citrophthora]KAK1929250.1 hypothetical protein P3T76_015202 [Phytophthora citrophthora]
MDTSAWTCGFALLSASDDYCFGGIIYGMQSAPRDSRPWPHYHLPVVVVNKVGDLYCSVLDIKPVVATNLQSNRWYHLLLSYDCNLQHQDVYLDGDNVHSATGSLHEEWEFITHEQVGTGCVTGGEDRFPYRGHLGWYGFHGLVDEFRVWGQALNATDAVELAAGGNLPRDQLQATVKLHEVPWIRTSSRWVNVQKISRARPSEDVRVLPLG